MKKSVVFAFTFMIAMCVLMSLEVRAQSKTGGIAGYVTDDTKAPLQGVTVTVSSSGMPDSRQTLTDANGYYRFLLLPPGKYKIVADLDLFQKVTHANADVNVSAMVRLDFVMRPLTMQEEEIVVTAPAPTIETEKTTLDTVITSEILETIPLLDRDFMSALKILPGVTDSSYGVSISGGRDTQKNYNTDGTDNIDIAQGKALEGGGYSMSLNQPLLPFDQEAIQELSVATAGYSAETGFGSGGVINVVTKSGSNDFSGSLYLYARNDNWDYEPPYPYKSYQFGGSVGAPIVRDKLFLFASVSPTFKSTGYDIRQSLYSHVPEDLRRKSDGFMGFLKFTYLINSQNTLNISANVPRYSGGGHSIYLHIPPDFPGYTIKTNGFSLTVSESAVISQSFLLESTLSFGRANEDFVNDPGVHPGSITDYETWTATGGPNGNEYFKKTKINWFERANIFVEDWLGSHALATGFEVRYNGSDDRRELTENIYVYPSWYPPYFPAMEKYITDPYELSLSQTYIAAYVNDSWSPAKNVTLKLGVRFARNSYLSELLIEPRFGLAWDPFGDSRTVIRLGANYYRDRINSYVQQLASYPGSRYVEVYPDGFEWESAEPYKRIVIDENLVHPRTYEINFGIDRELTANLYFSASFVYREYKDMLFMRYTNLRDPVTGRRDDRTKSDLMYYSNSGYCDYKGLHLVLGKKFSNGYQFLVSYSYQASEGNSNLFTYTGRLNSIFNGRYLNKGDTQLADLEGKTAFDKPYDFKVFGSVVLPLDFVLAGVFSLTAGTPYTEYNRETKEMVSDFQEKRSPSLMNIDLRVEKDFRIKGTVTRIMLEAFNLTNRENILLVDADVSSPDYNQPYRIDSSRRIQIGVRFQW